MKSCLPLFLLLVLSGCAHHSQQVAGHRWTIGEDGDTVRFLPENAHPIRDMRTGRMLMVDNNESILRLWDDSLLCDTVEMSIGDVAMFDSTFAVVATGVVSYETVGE